MAKNKHSFQYQDNETITYGQLQDLLKQYEESQNSYHFHRVTSFISTLGHIAIITLVLLIALKVL